MGKRPTAGRHTLVSTPVVSIRGLRSSSLKGFLQFFTATFNGELHTRTGWPEQPCRTRASYPIP